jgi:apolipoprotein D and lipocalin family protein
MKTPSIWLGTCLLAAMLGGCALVQPNPGPLPTATAVDLDRYMGRWYVIAGTPGLYDRHAWNLTETYGRRLDGDIEILAEFREGAAGGKARSRSYSARVRNIQTNADWGVRYVWPARSDYKIIHVEPDYSLAIVGMEKRDMVWILTRSPTIDAPRYADLMLYVQALGYDVSRIRRVPQVW